MTVDHDTLTGAELHEPKGIAAASDNTVLVADGVGSGSWDSHANFADPDIHEPKDVDTANSGEVYTANGSGSGTWSLPPTALITTSFESTLQTITPAGTLTLAHNLGGDPKFGALLLECTSAEFGYSVGDKVRVSAVHAGANNQGISIVTDSTNINVKYGSGAGAGSSVFTIIDKSTGNSQNITNASWDTIFLAFF